MNYHLWEGDYYVEIIVTPKRITLNNLFLVYPGIVGMKTMTNSCV